MFRWLTALGCAQADSVFSGISTFGRLPYSPCLKERDVQYDIAFLGKIIMLERG
jgi:hypothetical protein